MARCFRIDPILLLFLLKNVNIYLDRLSEVYRIIVFSDVILIAFMMSATWAPCGHTKRQPLFLLFAGMWSCVVSECPYRAKAAAVLNGNCGSDSAIQWADIDYRKGWSSQILGDLLFWSPQCISHDFHIKRDQISFIHTLYPKRI